MFRGRIVRSTTPAPVVIAIEIATVLFMILGFKLLIAATLFIGRVDIPFLSEEACFIGPFELDAYPLMFRKDLLTHEAHRHPYLERMGVMYMMKMRHDDFGNYAGTCWRMLFIYALVPWMRKYRNSEDSLGVTGFKFVASRMWTGRMPAKSEIVEKSNAPIVACDSDVRSLGILMRENEILKRENEMMRCMLFQRESVRTNIATSCPPRIVGENTCADTCE